MIPRKIHYCWFGGNPLPESAQICIDSWKKYCPEYEIVRWDETNFDVNTCTYTKEAYDKKKWAFVSDYARFWILYHVGGVYFDTDVELIKPIDDLLLRGPFMGVEVDYKGTANSDKLINPGLGLAAPPGLHLYKEILDYYQKLYFVMSNGRIDDTTVVKHMEKILRNHTLVQESNEIIRCEEIFIYPKEYFCPLDYGTGELNITSNTRSIHHYTATWMEKGDLQNAEVFRLCKKRYGSVLGKGIAYALTFVSRAKRRGFLNALLAK